MINKYFTKEVKIALTAIVAIVLLFVGINFLKGINVFQRTNTYLVRFENVGGLAISNPVYANGYPVGIVRDIAYDYSRTDNVVVTIELDDAMRVPVGTRAELESELMGGVKMSLLLGDNPTRHLTPGDTLNGSMHQGAMAKLETMMPTIERMMPKLDSIMTNLNRLTGDSALQQTLRNTAEITSHLSSVSRSLDAMMSKEVPQLTARMNRTMGNVESITDNLAQADLDETVTRLNATLDNAQRLTANLNQTTGTLNAKLNGKDNTLGLLLNDRSFYDRMTGAMGSADSLLIDLRLHPKRYVHFSIFGKKDK